MISRDSFFEAVRLQFPLDPPIQSSRSWDSLSDSLWGGLNNLTNNRILIIWPDSSSLAQECPEDFEMALNILEDVAFSLGNHDLTNGHPKLVSVIIA